MEIVGYLAVALAQIHTWDKIKSEREQVEIGVGSNDENLAEWVEDIWAAYALHSKKDGLMRRHEFERFVKNTFKMATFQYKYNQKLFNEMYMTKIKLTDGKIDKPDMEAFLRSL